VATQKPEAAKMLELFRRTMIGQRIGLGAVALGLFAISIIIVYTFKALGGTAVIDEFFELLPAGMKAILHAQGGFATDAEGYLAADYRVPPYLVAISAFVIASTSGAIAREIERGTVLMLLAAPIPRWRFLAAKVAALVVGITLIALSALAGTWLGVVLTGTEGVSMATFLLIQVMTFAFAFSMGGIGLLVSSLTSDGGQAMGITTAIIVTMFFVDFLSLLWSPAEALGPFAVFHYYDPLSVSVADALPMGDMLVLMAVGLIGTAAAFVVFNRRDITR
jgi:ABC-type transport system involved in multi-copper enzyme maturation permease subunit